jgi:hypothetical protein
MTRRDACLEAFNTSPTDGSFTPPADRLGFVARSALPIENYVESTSSSFKDPGESRPSTG